MVWMGIFRRKGPVWYAALSDMAEALLWCAWDLLSFGGKSFFAVI